MNLNINPIVRGEYVKYEKEYQELPKSFMLDKEGSYYLIVSVKDKAGNASAPFIAVYNYEKDYYKKIKYLSFYSDSGYNKNLGMYDFNFIEDPNEYIGNGLWQRYYNDFDDGLTCKTRLKNIYVEWNYSDNIDNNGSVVKLINKENLAKIEMGKIVKNNRFSITKINIGDRIRSTMEVCNNNFCWGEILQPNDKVNYNLYIKPSLQNNELFNKHKILNLIYDTSLNEDITCISKYDIHNKINKLNYNFDNALNFFHRDVKYNSLKKVETDYNISNKLKGQILLQVESHGEAWYVNPSDGKRYYMKDGPTAYEMMRRFGLGISNANLARLPQEGENKSYPTTLNYLKGKILLQVEARGEAWYVHPKTGIRYYMKDGEAAYNLMRYHSLGITNSDLSKIPEGSL